MPDTRDPRSVIDAAEQAAAAGDHASAERLLREAATIQEAALGPLHPDLANTLNNLGVVCEIVEKPDEAERCFRRAHAILTAALEADHPFVATSRKNLEDFCAARGKAVDLPKVPPLLTDILPGPPLTHAGSPEPPRAAEPSRSADVLRTDAPPPAIDRPPAVEPPRMDDRPRASDLHRTVAAQPAPNAARGSSRGLAISAMVAGGLLVAVLLGVRWFGGDEPSESLPSTAPAASSAETPRTRPEPTSTAEPAPRGEPAAKNQPRGTTPKKSSPGASGATATNQATQAAAGPRPSIAEAQLCMDRPGGPGSSEWRCVPVARPAAPGRLLFYTRLKSPRDTNVRHRWYQGNRLRQSVDLTIRANAGSGYRTFSRSTVSSGEWRVELRSRDGALLHEERFTVR